MQVTKYCHCCLFIEENEARILIDPGSYSNPPFDLKLNAIFITHQHSDHIDVSLLKNILAENTGCPIYTCQDVSEILSKEGISSTALKEGQVITVKNTPIKTVGKEHAILYQKSPCMNHGFLVSNRFFFPGDALTIPNESVEILALPVAGPWLKLSDAIEYAIKVKPKIAFPVHDGILKKPGTTNTIPQISLPQQGIQWIIPEDGKKMGFG
ncbi:MAG: MBL fold metallo-hydrolase [Candidatus Diapherotrites archaeon]|nr:MBL fold metallo-hydrolase [Candidatus Diapherotrites archaeon]